MKKNLIFLSLITVSLLVTSCFSSGSGDRKELRDRLKEILDEEQEEVEMENVEINGLYSMDVPEHMTVSLTMNEDASLQYMNETRNEYIIVIDEDKEEFKTIFQALGMYDDDLSLIENYAISQESFTMDAATSVLDEEDIEKIMWDNPIELFSKSGAFSREDVEEEIEFDQSVLFEGNSVLRGQTPEVRKNT